jgi:flagellin-specific chaperone FliS
MAEDKNKDSAKYIKTIEELTQELNEAYRKVNEHTRNSLENKDRDGSK